MDTPPPSAVEERQLVAHLARGWSIEPDDLRYLPKGLGSYHWEAIDDDHATHFITVDDLDTKPWIGCDRASTFAGLTAAYSTAWVLHHDDGIESVVPPIRSDDGAIAVRIADQFTMAVFPFVDGVAGRWGDPLGAADRTGLVRELARLHAARHGRSVGVRPLPHHLPDRSVLDAALNALDRPWSGGRFSEQARRALLDNEEQVHRALAHFDHLGAELDRTTAEPVVTHGEPHPGNLIRSADAVFVVDWDTVALAEPERDLWMIADDADAVAGYTELTGRPISPTAIAFYRLAWTLSDIASLADLLRSPHPHTTWTEQKLRTFLAMVDGGSSTPHRLLPAEPGLRDPLDTA